jgi:hypothetical protein
MMENITYNNNNDTMVCFLGQQVLGNGQTLYLGFEQLTDSNFRFWRDYYQQTNDHEVGKWLALIILAYKQAEKNASDTEDFCKYRSLDDYKAFSEFVSSISWNDLLPYHAPLFKRALSGYSADRDRSGIDYLAHKICPILSRIDGTAAVSLIEPSAPCSPRFMVYGSTEPITQKTLKKHCDHLETVTLQEINHYVYYQDIVISVPYATDKKTPTFSHFGFFKNPWHAVDPKRFFARTGPILKGFSAYVSGQQSDILGNKLYLIIPTPLTGAMKTLAHALGEKNIHVCSEYWSEHMSGFAKKSLGDSLLVYGPLSKNNDPHWAMKDPDTGALSNYFRSLDGPGECDLDQGRVNGHDDSLHEFIAIKRERLEIFYRESGKIKDPDVMLRLLNYLKTHANGHLPHAVLRLLNYLRIHDNGQLPRGLAHEIAHAYNCEDTLTVDDAIQHYENLSHNCSRHFFFNHDASTQQPERDDPGISDQKYACTVS